jgi:hypothetical protein
VKMMDKLADTVINCLTFQEQEPILRDAADKINKARGVQDRIRLAKELQKEVDVLLSCPAYDSEAFDCRNCRFIANLHRKTAAVFIRGQKDR